MPKPLGAPSISSPIDFAKSPLPSARKVTVSRAPLALAQASRTKTSFTDVQAIRSTPFALKSAACCTKPGRCLTWQVGVNAPGTANKTAFLPLNSSSVETSDGPGRGHDLELGMRERVSGGDNHANLLGCRIHDRFSGAFIASGPTEIHGWARLSPSRE